MIALGAKPEITVATAKLGAGKKLSVPGKLSIAILMLVFTGLLALFGAVEINKTATLHKLNYLHIQYNRVFLDHVLATDNYGANLRQFERDVNLIRAQPLACIKIIGVFEQAILAFLGTSRALELCIDDVALADRTLFALEQYESGSIADAELAVLLQLATDGFQNNSAAFEPLVDQTANFVFKFVLIILSVGSLGAFAIVTFLMRSVANDYRRINTTREELRQYEHIVSSTNDMMALIDQKYVYLAANNAYLRAFNKASHEVVGRSIPEIFGDEVFEKKIKVPADRCLAGEEVRYQDWIDLPMTGRTYRDVTYSPYLEPNGEVCGIVVNSRDITDRVQSEEALRRSETRYRHLIESTEVSIWDEDFTGVFDALEKLRDQGVDDLEAHLADNPALVLELATCIGINGVNSATLKLFGGTFEEDFISSIDSVFSADSSRVFADELCAIWRGDGNFRAETTHLTLSGKKIDVVISMPVPKTRDQARSVPVSFFDITERRKYETAIADSENRFRMVFDTIETGMIVIDTDGIIQIFNPAAEEIFGYKSDEVVDQNVSMLMPEPDRSGHDGYLQKYVKTGKAKVVGIGRHVTGIRKDGNEFPMQIEIGEMKIGGDTCFVGSIADLTELQSLESQLRQSQKLEAVGQLTGGIAHDFNNLLAVIQGNLSLLAQDLVSRESAEINDPMELLEPALSASKRGADLTQRLLAFSRKQTLKPKVLCLNTLVTGMEALLRRTLGEAIDLRVVLRGAEWKSMIDSSQLENSILNLALNARDAMPDGGRLTIERDDVTLDKSFVATHPEANTGEFIVLSVSDTGTGMTPEVRDKVFDPFFTTKGVGKGSGLGLSMVHGFVRQSGGYVTIYSEAGEGTTVKLYLPRTRTGDAKALEKNYESATEGGNETILVVEDEGEVRRLTVRILIRLGYRIFEAGNGKDALILVENEDSIDLLLSDVVLPGGMNGPKIAAATYKINPRIKVLFMSGYTENAIVHHGRLDEGTHLISKPFSPNSLASKVREMLDAVN